MRFTMKNFLLGTALVVGLLGTGAAANAQAREFHGGERGPAHFEGRGFDRGYGRGYERPVVRGYGYGGGYGVAVGAPYGAGYVAPYRWGRVCLAEWKVGCSAAGLDLWADTDVALTADMAEGSTACEGDRGGRGFERGRR